MSIGPARAWREQVGVLLHRGRDAPLRESLVRVGVGVGVGVSRLAHRPAAVERATGEAG